MPDSTTEPLRIIYLEAENVKRLKAVRIKPDKTLVRIEGRNAQGKTSVIDAICACLGGGKWQPEKPVREGEKKARVSVDLGDLQVERRWTARGGTTLEVTANGDRQATPQAILDKLVGDLTFDPLAFVRMKSKDQADILRRLAGIDFADLDAKRQGLYDARTVANREAKSAEARRGPMPAKPKSDKPIDVRELAHRQQVAITHNREVQNARDAADRAAGELKVAQKTLANAQARVEEAAEQAKVAQEHAQSMTPQDVGDLGAELVAAEEHNKAIAEWAAWEKRDAEAVELEKMAESYTDQIEALDAEKAKTLQEASFPLAGLSLDANGVCLGGVPFAQASSAEQLRCGVAIGLAQRKRARLGFIRDGSLLDADNLQLLHDIAAEYDAQIFVERVAESPDASAVYIEDGEIIDAD